jgi:CRISPR-associated exonuclease Cas4
MYSEEELLMLSGIQHIAFCERQWALIHIEQQWSENVLTVEGHHMHEKADDPFENESRGNTSTLRSLAVVSRKLGLYGIADVVELIRVADDHPGRISIAGKTGKWMLYPVEYKRGKPKPDECDEVQLCAQAMCLEEMYGTALEKGSLFYGETKHRQEVNFTNNLKRLVADYTKRMHELFIGGVTPPPVYQPHCKSCSLKDICLPKALGNMLSVTDYLDQVLKE